MTAVAGGAAFVEERAGPVEDRLDFSRHRRRPLAKGKDDIRFESTLAARHSPASGHQLEPGP